MLKRGEVDLAYLLDAPLAQEVKRDPNLKLAFSGGIGTFYLDFLDQWDPKSPWHDRRVRLAASHAIDRKALNEAETLGASRPDRQHRAEELRVRAAARAARPTIRRRPSSSSPRPAIRTASTPAISTRGRPISRPARRSADYLGAVGHQDAHAHDGARGLLLGAGVEEAEGLCICINAVYGNAASRLSEIVPADGRLRLWRLSRHRRSLQAAGEGDGQEEALLAGRRRLADPGARRSDARAAPSATSRNSSSAWPIAAGSTCW